MHTLKRDDSHCSVHQNCNFLQVKIPLKILQECLKIVLKGTTDSNTTF